MENYGETTIIHKVGTAHTLNDNTYNIWLYTLHPACFGIRGPKLLCIVYDTSVTTRNNTFTCHVREEE